MTRLELYGLAQGTADTPTDVVAVLDYFHKGNYMQCIDLLYQLKHRLTNLSGEHPMTNFEGVEI